MDLFDEFIEFRAEQAFQSGKKYHVTLSGLTDRAANPLPKTVLSVVSEEALVTSLAQICHRIDLICVLGQSLETVFIFKVNSVNWVIKRSKWMGILVSLSLC